MLTENFLAFVARIIVVVIAISIHEFAHAFVAYKCGDPTAKYSGRMTVNPAKHFDLSGFAMLAIVGFGYAKPVPINSGNFRKQKTGIVMTSLAGVIFNILLAFIFAGIYVAIVLFTNFMPTIFDNLLNELLYYIMIYMITVNLSLFAFNLLPIYPLDGFRIVEVSTRSTNRYRQFMYRYSRYILLGLILLSIAAERFGLPWYLNPLGTFMSFVVGNISLGFTSFWAWVFGA